MKKIIIIIILLIFNFCIVYAKINEKKLAKVDIKLRNDELGIITINLEESTSLLLKYKDKYYLYLIDYITEKNINNSSNIFTDHIDYVYMNNNYNFHHSKVVIAQKQKIDNDLVLSANKIYYKDKLICINQSYGCDYVFINHDDVLLNEKIKAIFYSNKLSTSYIDYLKNFWIDKYRLSNDNYTVITIGDEYQVNNLVK